MSKLIDQQVVIDAVEVMVDKSGKGEIAGFYNTILERVIDKLIALPYAQSEILRCKDCIYWWESHKMCKRNKDKNHNCACMDCDADFYCKYAERRTDERTD